MNSTLSAMTSILLIFVGGMGHADESNSSVPASAKVESFEEARPGPFAELETELGVWESREGRAIIDDQHAKSGDRCLQLAGGRKTRVTLTLADDVDTTGELTFWAERWTKRQPFSFRIDKNSGSAWEPVFDGAREIRVGRSFLSHITVPLGDEKIQQLRFTVTSPPDTGVLLDDIRVAPALPQEIVSVESVPLTLPALLGIDSNPLLKLKITTEGQLDPISVNELRASVQCKGGEVESVEVLFSKDSSQLDTAKVFGTPINVSQRVDRDSKSLTFAGDQTLAAGENYLWIACKLSKDANIDHKVGALCSRVSFSNGKSFELAAVSTQRMGVSVRNGGDNGVNRYRIPGLATTNLGTLIGVYDIRHRNGGDLPGDIDVGMSRSTDGGRSWEPMQVIMDMGDDPKWTYDGIGDPAVLVDKNTGTIWVAATWSHGNRSWRGSGPGLKPEETGQLMLVRSDDDGMTWSNPINITEQVKKPEWCFLLQGPGKGITMRDGTIVFAAQYQDPPNGMNKTLHRLPHSTIIYSKDHGTTWHAGTGAFDDTTEAQVVEVEPGVLMLNCRYNRKAARVVMTTRDMGKTWQKHSTSERSLIEPGSCMASLIDVDQEVGKSSGGWLLFSNPDSTRARNHITIKASPDRGLTWPKRHRLLLDEGSGAGYSCMSMIDEKTVGILYEGSRAHMTFQRVPLSDLVGKTDVSKISSSELSERRLKIPPVFGSHMVLQADAELPVWGQSKSNSKVTVTLGDVSRRTVANAMGEWKVRLPAQVASAESASMEIKAAGDRILFTDVLVGEVWVCAGQSNMEWTLAQSANGHEELSQVNIPQLRLLHLAAGARGSSSRYTPQHLSRLSPQTYCEGEWKPASANSARSFSAVAWYFGRRLQDELKVPVGLICPAVGGTPAEAWIPRQALEADPDLKGLVAGNWLDNERLSEFCRLRGQQNLLAAIQAGESIPGDSLGPNHSFKPGFMWDSGIRPLIPFAIRGAIWYQGESNAETSERAFEHQELFPLLVKQWRTKWGQGDFPFLFVQLPALNRAEWPWFRDGQRRMLGQLKNVGMAVTIDTGHPTDVHPKRKKPVGERLAIWALGTTYQSKTHATYSGPMFDVAERKSDSILVSFKHVGSGLKSSDGKPLRHFEVCGEDGVFHKAIARIVGQNVISLSSVEVLKPIDARYAWLPYPDPSVNLFNSADLPASPFTTENIDAVFARRTAEVNRPNILSVVSKDIGEHLGRH